jgi:TRAP-type C4-dicarboxylate transport system substrate-binding protein
MSDIAQETMKSFGFSPVPTEIDETSKTVLSGKAVGAEHVAQRLFPDSCDEWIDVIFDTQHSLFLTSIVVNTDWWNNLDPSIREMFSMAAIESARNERALSIEDGEKSLERLSENGVKIVHLNDNEMKSLKEKSQAVYEKYSSNFFTSNLIDKIKKWKI